MGREIRTVPADWQHPKDSKGHFIPLHDDVYDQRIEEWIAGRQAWKEGTYPSQEDKEAVKGFCYEEWVGGAPYYEDYAHYKGERNAYQYYECTTEGTPLSPVFTDMEDLIKWMVENEDFTEEDARGFAQDRYMPTMTITITGSGTDGRG